MKIIIGGIYEINREWHPYDEDIINHRPGIVIKEEGDYVYIILMDVLHANSRKDKKMFFEYYIDGNKFISAISCDVIHRIKKNLLINNLGCVSNNIVEAIIKCNGKISPKAHNIKSSDKENSDDITYNKSSDIIINDKEKLLNLLLNIYQDTSLTRKITERTNKKINIWKERCIGFFFGVLASLLATIIYENRSILLNFLYSKANGILKYIINLFQ